MHVYMHIIKETNAYIYMAAAGHIINLRSCSKRFAWSGRAVLHRGFCPWRLFGVQGWGTALDFQASFPQRLRYLYSRK